LGTVSEERFRPPCFAQQSGFLLWQGPLLPPSVNKSRVAVAALALGAFGLAAYLGGVQGGGFGDFIPKLAAILLLAPLMAIAVVGRTGPRVAFAALLVMAGVAAMQAGGTERARAFNECVERGEEVRQALQEYRQATGRYPAALSDLGRPLPCQPALWASLLAYTPTAPGYTLSFRDSLVTFSATESAPFDARK
jgi:hypothetical protein